MNAWSEIVVRDGQLVKIFDGGGRLVGVVAGANGAIRYLTDRVEPAPGIDPDLLARISETSKRLTDMAKKRDPAPSGQLVLQDPPDEVAPATAPKASTSKVSTFRLRELTARDVEQIYTAVSRATTMGNALTALEMEGPFVSLDYRRRNQALLILMKQGRTHLCYTARQGPRHYYRTGPASSCTAPAHGSVSVKRQRRSSR